MNAFYRHYKQRYYQVVGEALDTQNDSHVIVYRTLYPSEYVLFTRPKEEFFGQVTREDGSVCLRFTPVSFSDLPREAREFVIGHLPVETDGMHCNLSEDPR